MKQIKRIAALTLILVQLFLLCGCNALDQMRETQAFYDVGKINRNGVIYQLLPSCEELNPPADLTSIVYVTPPDVPVLLSRLLANEQLWLSTDGNFLISLYDDNIYCRQEMHQQMSQRIREGFTPEVVCYSYETYDEETDDVSEDTYILTDEQVEVIELIISTVEPQTMGEGWWLDYDWSVALEECSADMLFRRSDLEIAVSGRTFYLLLYTDTETLAFTVPTGCNAQLEEITKAYLDSWESYWGSEESFV